MSEVTQKKVAELYASGKGYQNDANEDTIKEWVKLYVDKKPVAKKVKEVKHGSR